MDGTPAESRAPARGFTLIEIAIVVAIAMTLLTLGLGLVSAQLSSAAVSVTKKRQEAIKDALIAYLSARKRLPCPHVPVGPPTPINGVETPPTTPPPPECPAFGIVPFATLGLAREFAEDGWGNLFSYTVYADTSPPPSPPACTNTSPSIRWDWGNAYCFGEGKDGVSPQKIALTINNGTPSPPTNVVAVVISHGANGLGAWAAQGTRNVAPTTPACEEAYNTGISSPPGCPVVSNTFYKGERQENDDIVAFLTASEALQTLAKQATIKSASGKVNEDLQTLADMALGVKRAGITISIPSPCASEPCTLTPTDGCDKSVLTAELKEKLNSMRDPWGDPYFVDDTNAGSVPAGGKFPICIYSKGGGPTTCSSTCTTNPPISPNPPAICKGIDKPSFNSYLARAGSSGC